MVVVNLVILVLNIGFCLSCSDGINDDLLKRIKGFEDRETFNAARINHLEDQAKINNEMYEILHQQNIILKNDLAMRNNKLDQMEQMIADLNHKIDGINKTAENEHAILNGLRETVKQVQKTQTSLVNAIKPYNNALLDHVGIFSNSSELDKHIKIQNELSSIQVNRNIPNDTKQLRQANEMLKLLDENLDMQHRIKRPDIAKQSGQQNDIVAFHAVLTPHRVDHLGTNENIKFDHVHLNEGNGYHNQHGVFIVPRSGIYLFSSTLTSTSDKDFWADLVKNGQILASLIGGDDAYSAQGSVTAVAHLTVGDEVWVRHIHPIDGTIWGNYYSSFCGVLLLPE